MMALIIVHLVLVVLLIPYFLPTIVAIVRKKRNVGAIAILNFFLGWTLIGWIVALVWALTADAPAVAVTNITNYPPAAPTPPTGPIQGGGTPVGSRAMFCQGCGVKLLPEAIFCPSCGRRVA
jgi:hypothetical protein